VLVHTVVICVSFCVGVYNYVQHSVSFAVTVSLAWKGRYFEVILILRTAFPGTQSLVIRYIFREHATTQA